VHLEGPVGNKYELRLLIVSCDIKHMKRMIIPILIILLSLAGCNSSEDRLIRPIADGKRTYQEFISEAKTFPYTISESRKKAIITNYSMLNIGMTKKQVSSILGDPDFSIYLRAKDSKYLGSEWTYYFYKPDANLVNEKLDRGLFLFFGTNDKLHWIVPKNIEGLIEKGNPRQSGS
jgi:outer membrane protein assembly factor BamE (lipoprotein component of BamABCDE complex)